MEVYWSMSDQQIQLFQKYGEAYARRTDPETAHDSAKKERGERASRLEKEIFDTLKRNPNGLTNHEIVEVTGLSWNTCTPRIAPLVRKNMVMDSGERRKGPTSHSCIVWKAI
jgi:predicted HTH transcriptional regulator